jgi:hypothetical protein
VTARTSVLLHVSEIRTRADGSVVLVLEGGHRITVKRSSPEHHGQDTSWLAYAARAAEAEPGDHVCTAAEIADRRRVAKAGQGAGLGYLSSIAF